RLIEDVTRAVKFGKLFAHGSIKRGLGCALRPGMDCEPPHLEIALSWPEHRASSPEIVVDARRQRPEGGVLPDLEHFAQIGIAFFGRGSAINDNDRLTLGIVSSDHTPHGLLKF